MLPPIQNPWANHRSHSRSIHQPNQSTSWDNGRLPKLSGMAWNGPRSKRSHTDPKVIDYRRLSRWNQPRRRVRSLVQSRTPDSDYRRRRRPSLAARTAPVETTYILNPPSANRYGKFDKSVSNVMTLEEREAINEGVSRQSRFIKAISDDRMVRSRYYFEDAIGEGNFSVVIRCFSKNGGMCSALKIVRRENLGEKIYYVENEADLLSRFSHPNIMKLHEAYKTTHEYYLFMEYVENGDLFDALKRAGSFSEPRTASIVKDVASAISYLHNRYIVHRDIKPENLLLTIDYRVKLGDFGLACQVRGPLCRVCGTPTYVAPEILAETGYGLPVDCWSLGVIMYILLCGYAPFRHNDRDELFRVIQRGRFQFDDPIWRGISQGAKNLITSLLTVDPWERCNAKQVLRNPWLTKRGKPVTRPSSEI